MNANIQRLMQQATVEEMDLTWGKRETFKPELFAELLIKEIDNHLRTTDYNDLDCDNNTALETAADDILDMFGIVNKS